jgi:hypothetical protein
VSTAVTYSFCACVKIVREKPEPQIVAVAGSLPDPRMIRERREPGRNGVSADDAEATDGVRHGVWAQTLVPLI